MDDVGPYPGNKPQFGSVIFVHYGDFFHTGELALRRLPDLMRMANSIHDSYDGDLNRMLGVICVVMSDCPSNSARRSQSAWATATRSG